MANAGLVSPDGAGAVGLLVKQVGRIWLSRIAHLRVPRRELWNRSTVGLVWKPRPAHAGVSRNCFGRKALGRVGDTGFEPVTSSV